MQDNAIILGGQALNIGIVDILHSLGLNVIVIDYRKNIALKSDLHILFDATDPEVINVVKENNIENVKLVYTSMDDAGLAQLALCNYYRLLCADKKALEKAHNKTLMHKAWNNAGLLNRISIALKEFDFEKISVLNKKFDIVIKPSDSCASRGITILSKNSSYEDIKKAFELALENSSNHYVNVEEFVLGTEYTVELLGDNYDNVCVFGISQKYHTNNTKHNKIAVKLHYNAINVDTDLQNRIAKYAIRCYRALELQNTLGHLELIVKRDGTISPIEIGARSSGFIASHLAQVGTNRIFLQDFMKVQNGEKIHNGLLKHNDISGMYYFYDMPANKSVKKITNITNFFDANVKSLYSDRADIKIGKKYQNLKQDTDRYGFEILIGDRNSLTIDAVKKAEERFYKELFDE